ncbi:MAG: S9 family peptidase [Phycisphaerae bacterium]|nr:S9 family peptidase [Gemmatimonadaceae bacterium]
MPCRYALRVFVLLLLAAPLSAQNKPLLTATDYGKWESLGAARLAPNGNWAAYGISRVNEENELRIRNLENNATTVVPFGLQPSFSADSRWVAYLVGVSPKERDRLVKEKKPVRNAFIARNLSTGDSVAVAEVSAFAFSADGRFVSLTRYPAEGKRVQDVLVHDLSKGTRLLFSNVSEQGWSEAKSLFAFTVAVEGGNGNGVQLFDGNNGTVRVLESSTSLYRSLTWRPKSEDLAVLRTRVEKEFTDTSHAVLTWRSASTSDLWPQILEAGVGVSEGLRVSEHRRPSWSKDGSVLYIGLRKREAAADGVKKSEDKVSDVEIWHPKDVNVIPAQRSSEQRDLRASMLASWRIGDSKVSQIGTSLSEASTILDGDSFATESDTKAYAFGQMFGRRDSDIWITDLSNGTRKKLMEHVRFFYGADPTGTRVSWFDGKDYWAMDVATGMRTNLTARLTAQKVDFVDRDDDHPNNVLPAIGSPTWTKDGRALLVNGEYDIWQLALDGSGGKRLTDGAREGLTHRLVNLSGGGGFGAAAGDRAVDFSKPVYLALYGKRSKKSGYARLENGTVTRLVLADASVGALAKADSADRYVFTRQRFDESANLFVAGGDLANAKQLTTTNTFQKDYAWGKAELMDFRSSIGVPLQAILYYPANYDKNKKYPMIVYTYELLTQGLHRYITPRENDYYNANVFTQHGYFVLMPDIVFRPREPGIAVLQSVEPAVKAVIARGLVDAARVGHAGHSQGGYEAAYLATHSKLFATTVMGSGISDMWSFAGQMHWSSVPEFDHWETGQFRMQVPPWEDVAAMNANSPLAKVHTMYAKSMLVEIGSEDGTVDMRQGVELYNYARRAGKHVVMLLYPGEGHSLAKKENAVDYERRILQWFAHYLKGETAEKWITEGQTWIERKKILDANK